jgi:S-DNA-T family DNA segregation ATPase FtsK/SpoIIIE
LVCQEVSGARNQNSGWSLPSIDILKFNKEPGIPDEENQLKARLIETTLADYGIEVTVASIRPGPVVTQFGLTPGWSRKFKDIQERDHAGLPIKDDRGRLVKRSFEDKTRVKVDAILSREKDLALALAASSIRMEAPVPGESLVGLEVPNSHPSVVSLRSMIEDPAFSTLREKGGVPIVFGRSSGGEPIIANLVDMPHLLIAGATGSGKSVCINTIVCSLLMQFSPMDLRLILIDPKRVELTPYRGLPHLLTPVMVEAEDAVPALRNLISEMKARYSLFEGAGVRDIENYNRKVRHSSERLPFIILIIDELADLMMAAPHELEQTLCRLAQLCRATGIHLIVATQRPSVDVITGLIKANIPSRISFAVSSQVDSRTILDGSGAEKLLGRGDMLFLPTNLPKPKRLQGAFISDEEVEKLTTHWKKANNFKPLPEMALQNMPPSQPKDSLLEQAQELAGQYRRLSASLLQRKLGIGFIKASSLVDQLEELGILESGEPGKSRNVIIS